MMNETAIENGLIPPSQYAKKYAKVIEAAILKMITSDRHVNLALSSPVT